MKTGAALGRRRFFLCGVLGVHRESADHKRAPTLARISWMGISGRFVNVVRIWQYQGIVIRESLDVADPPRGQRILAILVSLYPTVRKVSVSRRSVAR